MKRIIVVLCLFSILAGSVSAQVDYIGLFRDATGTECFANDSQPGLIQIRVIHKNSPGASASEFAVSASPGFTATWLGDSYAFSVAIGNTQDGVSIGYGTCLQSDILVATMSYFAYGTSDSCSFLEVVPHPSGGGSIEIVDCSNNVITTIGSRLYVNPSTGGECQCGIQQASQQTATWLYPPDRLGPAFSAASAEFGVPVGVLVVIGYMESKWMQRDGKPSVDLAYGVMGLRQSILSTSLQKARDLVDLPMESLKKSPTANIRGAAALLRTYFEEEHGKNDVCSKMEDLSRWGSVVTRSSGISTESVRAIYEDIFYRYFNIARPPGNKPADQQRGSGQSLNCATNQYPFVIDQAQANSRNYRDSNRPTSYVIDRVVMHVAQGSYSGTLDWHSRPAAGVSYHYLVGDFGQIAQEVCEDDVAYHAGKSVYNAHSVGVAFEGWADSTCCNDLQYEEAAAIVRYICDKYGIPKDRAHVIGHSEVPGRESNPDMGTTWDWCKFMKLVDASWNCGNPPPPPPPSGDRDCCPFVGCELDLKGLDLPGDDGQIRRSSGVADEPSGDVLADLRTFRDRFLGASSEGASLTGRYYKHAPELARVILTNPTLVASTKELVIKYSGRLRELAYGARWTPAGETIDSVVTIIAEIVEYTSGDLRQDLTAFQRALERARGKRISQIYDELIREFSGEQNPPKENPRGMALFQNSPNPFNPTTVISFYLAERAVARLTVYNTAGRLVAELVDGVREQGYNQVEWDAGSLSTGVYFYKLRTGVGTQTKKMILLK